MAQSLKRPREYQVDNESNKRMRVGPVASAPALHTTQPAPYYHHDNNNNNHGDNDNESTSTTSGDASYTVSGGSDADDINGGANNHAPRARSSLIRISLPKLGSPSSFSSGSSSPLVQTPATPMISIPEYYEEPEIDTQEVDDVFASDDLAWQVFPSAGGKTGAATGEVPAAYTDALSQLFITNRYQYQFMRLKSDSMPSSLASSTSSSSSGSSVGGMMGGSSSSSSLLLPATQRGGVRPIWVCPDGHIFLESFSPLYQQAYDFLIAIAEPVSRPELMHEYVLTPHSLFAAVSVGLQTDDIVSVLDRLSKVELPQSLVNKIRDCTQSYGIIKLVLRKNQYFVESTNAGAMETLLRDPLIQQSRVRTVANAAGAGSIISTLNAQLRQDDEDEAEEVYSFEVSRQMIDEVKRRCIELDLPPLEEYDFRNDKNPLNPDLEIDLQPTTNIRPYQERALAKMFGNGRGRSGVVVLPCGAGKTLVGITASSTIRKSTLVICKGRVAVEQWRAQFKLWTTIDDKHISRFTADCKEMFSTPSGVLITTYNMIASAGRDTAADTSAAILQKIREREWGLLILDEVHVVAATDFRKVFKVVAAHCKLGLTATPLREDGKISDLNFLIGPKLYEANWMDLQRAGHIASVQCAEILCEMTPAFYSSYLQAESVHHKTRLYIMNPVKFQCCQFLVNYHEKRGDKIIVYSDNLFALNYYAAKLGKYAIQGSTSADDRLAILSAFKQRNSIVKTIFLSTVGDDSIDLPEANVVIQISSHFGSGRQETQRVGRILRPKPRSKLKYNAYFYSLVSGDTKEMYYSAKRQQFLANQGFAFMTLTSRQLPLATDPALLFRTAEAQEELLSLVERADEEMELRSRGLGMFGRPKEQRKERSVSKSLLMRTRERELAKLRKAQQQQQQQQ